MGRLRIPRVTALVRWIESIGGLSRQGVIATSRWVQDHPLPSTSQQALWLVPASALIGVGVASLSAAGLGLSPFDVWLSAIAERSPLSFGQAAWVTSGALFLIAALFRVRPTVRSLSFILLNGLMIDLARSIIVGPDPLAGRLLVGLGGWIALVSGVAIVVQKGAAGGPFESMMQVAERHGRRPLLVRSLLEIGFFVAGLILGGAFGPMTIVIAFGMGPAIGTGLQALDDHRVGRELRLSGSGQPPEAPPGRR